MAEIEDPGEMPINTEVLENEIVESEPPKEVFIPHNFWNIESEFFILGQVTSFYPVIRKHQSLAWKRLLGKSSTRYFKIGGRFCESLPECSNRK